MAGRPRWKSARVRAGFFGGGTATALSGEQLCEIIEHFRKHLEFSDTMELTVEGIPETLTPEKLKMLKAGGVNRISFGVQSFSDHYLKMIGRGHTALEARRAIDMVFDAGFDNVAIDLMYRLPGQTVHEWEEDLKEAVRTGVHHLSTYSLFVEPGTPLSRVQHKGRILTQADEQTDLEMFRLAIEILGDAGIELYTLYDFAAAGKQCDHHLVNWKAPQEEYVGIGPGAFSFVRNGTDEFVYGNINPLDEYVKTVGQGKLPIDFGTKLSLEEQMARYMVLGVNGLRIPKKPFLERFGLSVDEVFGENIKLQEDRGLITNSPESLDLTLKGKLYISNVGKSFCTERNRMKPHPAGVDLQKGTGESLVGLTAS
jgi:oxygen-independent coproporphyrinogen-3 oxidase